MSRSFDDGKVSVHALRDVDLTIESGEVVGLLGVNGAGKTTLLRVVSTLLLPTAGRVEIDGFDVVQSTREVRKRLAVVFGGERGLYHRLSARDNIHYFAVLSGLSRRVAASRSEELLEQVGLSEAAGRRVETFSKGMKQRLHIAIGLLATPRLLMLDEPTVGLDPLEAHRLRESLADLGKSGVTMIITSHYLGDIERLCRRVVILDRGRITHDLPLRDLLATAGAVAQVVLSGVGSAPVLQPDNGDDLRLLGVWSGSSEWSATYEIRDWSPTALQALADRWPPGVVTDVRVEPVGLEHVFAQLSSAD